VVKFLIFIFLINLSFFAQCEILVDPSKPLGFQVKKERKAVRSSLQELPKLQSIVIKAGKQQAILNNNLYQQGQSVNGYKITQIDAEKVLLEYQKKTYKLTLYSANERFSQ
jgi:hypothetical protein